MKKITLLTMLALYLTSFLCSAQISVAGEPESWKIGKDLPQIPIKEMPIINREKLNIEDAESEKNNDPPRFGFKHYVSFSPNNEGIWIDGIDNSKIWLVKLKCPDAISINLLFNKFHLQEGSKMFIYNQTTKQVIGAFTTMNNKGSIDSPEGFGTGLVYGDEIIVELNVPKSNQGKDIVEFGSIVHGYRLIKIPEYYKAKLNNLPPNFEGSSECQVNINCPEGDDWQVEKKGIALILVGGSHYCTGSLINNTCRDGKLYFLTAHHCLINQPNPPDGVPPLVQQVGSNLNNWTFVWNYESPTCANPTIEPNYATTNGAVALAGLDSSFNDFLLLELTESPHQQNPPIDVYYNGWSRTEEPEKGGVGIHHPWGDIKKISTHDMTPIANTNCVTPLMDNYWEINWTIPTVSGASVVEPGSSGSPVFTADKKIIGQLYGPWDCEEHICDERTQEVIYGRFSKSWDYFSSSSSKQLAAWLDPLNLDPQELGGSYNYRCGQNIKSISGLLSGTALYNDANIIQSDATIATSADIRFNAGVLIELNPGFETEANSFFLAEIKPCPPIKIESCERPASRPQSSLSTEEVYNNKATALLFPNPAKNTVTLKLSSILNNTDIHVGIKDIMGKEVINYQFNSKEVNQNIGFEMDIASLINGVYFVSIKVNGSIETQKLVISK